MIKKILLLTLISVFLITNIPYLSLQTNAMDPIAELRRGEANEYLKTSLEISDYFESINMNGKPINEDLIKKGVISSDYPVFVYGDARDASIDAAAGEIIKNGEYRCWGYAYEGSLYANPKFPADYPFSPGTIIETKNFYKKPWNVTNNSLINRFLKGKLKIFDSDKLPDGKKDFFRESIIYGIGLELGLYANGDMFNKTDAELKESIKKLSELISKPNPSDRAIGFLNGNFTTMKWEDYVHIIQPPTDKSWGFGILFHNNGGKDYYFTVPLVPMALLSNDLIASFENASTYNVAGGVTGGVTCGVISGTTALLGIKVRSKFMTDETTYFSLQLTRTTDGKIISPTIIGLDENDLVSMTIPKNGEKFIYVTFTMPSDSNVKIKFKVNENGDRPKETCIENNFLEYEIEHIDGIPSTREYNLPYNVLSRDVKFPYVGGEEIVAHLTKDRGSWSGNATGQLDIVNNNKNLFRSFNVDNNPDVNEASETVIRQPEIRTTFERSAFGDDPENHIWLNWATPSTPKELKGDINSVISTSIVNRPYEYNCGAIDCTGHTGIAIAPFNPCTDTSTVKTYIYNGQKTMPDVISRHFKKVVENNTVQSKIRNMFWISDPYDLKVIRWMCRLDESGNEYGWKKIDGQYLRTFTQQNTAKITWDAPKPMSAIYKQEREYARSGISGAQYYPNAVFATDFDLQQAKYPIKSGYYFNPKGVYTCTVETTQYKDTPNDTKEHKELVEKLTNAFHYKSNLLYTVDGKRFQTLDISKANSSALGMNLLTIQSKFDKDTYRLERAIDDSKDSHKFFKEILEGYSDSNTLDSKDKYKYREYIKEGDIYKVHEKTVITFSISPPPGKKLYTYVRMNNGNYSINASVDSFTLNNYRYNGLTINKLNSLDSIPVTVHGSMYDDLINKE
jgi:hypothetical protein